MARKSVNTRIQGTAAEIMKLNMVKVEDALRRFDLQSRQLIQIHDEILLEVPLPELDLVKWILRTNMSTQYLNMPLPCTIKVGVNWGDVK
jgi:DNA polymerase-1